MRLASPLPSLSGLAGLLLISASTLAAEPVARKTLPDLANIQATKQAALASWRRLETTVAQSHGSGRKTLSGSNRITVEPFAWKRLGRQFVHHTSARTVPGDATRSDLIVKERNVGANDDYGFVLERRLDGQWELLGAEPAWKVGADTRLRTILYCAWSIADHPLHDIAEKPAFKIDRFSPVKHEDRSLVRMEFNYAPPEPARETHVGWVDLDPAAHWVVQRGQVAVYDRFLKRNAEVSWESKLREVTDKFAFPAQCKLTTRIGEQTFRTTIDFDRFELGGVEADVFRLPAFGLPEYEAEKKGRE